MEYLELAEAFPPPSPQFIRKHLRWLFRCELEDAFWASRSEWLQKRDRDTAGWRVCSWTFLEQPYLTRIWQFRELVRLVAHRLGRGASGDATTVLSFREIREGQ